MSVVIKAEQVSKQYRLGEVGTGTLSHDLNRFWYRIRGKEDPYLKIGEANDRTKKGSSDYVWALKDVSFEVQQGEVLGIIGRNGAGKSTLLKILSRTTAPTTGTIKAKGRIASLLEVGTGFHPELSGRENIFLNGAILGMRKKEIERKFDEIIDFAGVERYIDTPVKRYSSGMYVRLAFAVAAHLESEILIVDEVLAVGDAEFQKKCLGKMKDVSSGEGRTVLFVSHNMAAMSKLCTKGIFLNNGIKEKDSSIIDCINAYSRVAEYGNENIYQSLSQDKSIFIKEVTLNKIENIDKPVNLFYHDEVISVKIKFVSHVKDIKTMTLGIALLDQNKEKLFTNHFEITNSLMNEAIAVCEIPRDILNQGYFSFDVAIFQRGIKVYEYLKDICGFKVIDRGSELYYQSGDKIGSFRVNCNWRLI